MSSQSLAALLQGVEEVRALRSHYPVRAGGIASGVAAVAAKAHGRASVVLLSSHYERYFYSVNEEAISWINTSGCRLDGLPLELLLQHSQGPVDELAQVNWLRRETHLKAFMGSDAALWTKGGSAGALDHSRLMTWMKSPKPAEIKRLYRQYGVDDIFRAVTRSEHTRRDLFLDLRELVEKRNNIAHGDAQTEALPADVTRYLRSVPKFAASADSVLARRLRKNAGSPTAPW